MALLDLKPAETEFFRGNEYLPTDLSPDGLRSWLLDVTRLAGITPTELAKHAQIAPSTVNKFLQNKGATNNLGARTIKKLTDSLQVLHFDRENRARVIEREQSGIVPGYVKVLATIRAGVFRDNHLWPTLNQMMMTVPVPAREERGLIGFAVADDAAGETYPYGTIVICSTSAVRSVESGQRFVASLSNGNGGTEIMLRQAIISPNEDVWLTSLASKQHRAPDVYMGKLSDAAFTDNRSAGAYSLEYRVISALLPEPGIMEDVLFA